MLLPFHPILPAVFGQKTAYAPTPAQIDRLVRIGLATPKTADDLIRGLPEADRRELLRAAWKGLATNDAAQARRWTAAWRGVVRLARALGEERSVAKALLTGGGLAVTAQNWVEADRLLREAASVFARLGDRASEGKARLDRMIALTATARFEDGIAEGKRALAILRGVGDWKNESILDTQLSDAYLRIGKVREARRLASDGLRAAADHGDKGLTAMARLNLANAQIRAGEDAEALVTLAAATAYFETAKDRANYATCEANRSVALLDLKRFAEAESALRLASGAYVVCGDRAGAAAAELNRAALLISTGRYAQAAETSLRAEGLARSVDQNTAMMAVGNYGSALQEQGMYAEAFEAMQRFRLLARRQRAEREEAVATAGIGDALAGLGRRPAAVAAYREAIGRLQKTGNLGYVASFRATFDVLRAIEGDPSAPPYLNGINRAVRELARNPRAALRDAREFLALPEARANHALRSVGLYTVGRALLRLRRDAEALSAIEGALDGFVEQRSRTNDPLFATYAMRGSEGIIGDIFEAGARTASPERLFRDLQKASGATVRRALLGANVLTKGLSMRESDGLLSLYQAYRDSARAADLGRLLAYEGRLRVLHPRWAGMEAEPADSWSIGKALGRDSVGVEYVVADQAAFALCLSQAGLKLIRLRPNPASLRSDVDALRRGILGGLGRTDPTYLTVAQRLYRNLLDPVLRHTAPKARLVFAARGPLSGLPLAATVDPRGRYAIQSRPMIETPSLSAWLACRRRDKALLIARARKPLLVAISRFGGRAKARTSMPGGPLARLSDLASVRREAAAVRKWAPNAFELTETRATRDRVLAAMRMAGAIHLATHAAPDERSPLLGAFVLSPDRNGKPSYLSAAELTFMSLDARFAFLSACATGSGAASGDGPLGLSWAFTVAGVPTVIASRWDIADSAAATWVESFYRAQPKGRGLAAAAQRASIDLIRRGGASARPVAWAAWGVFGSG